MTQLKDYFEKNDLPYVNQFGYRKRRSTEHAVMKMTERIREGLDRSKICGVLQIDLKKAFDSVKKEVLLAEMKAYGVQGKALQLIEY